MPPPSTLGVFVLACLVFLAVPGPSVLYILAQSIEHGRRGGLAAVLGIHLGTVVHVVAPHSTALPPLRRYAHPSLTIPGGTSGRAEKEGFEPSRQGIPHLTP